MPTKRSYLAAGQIELPGGGGTGIVVAGGITIDGGQMKKLDTVDIYDIEEDQWSVGQTMHMGAW